MKEFGNRLRKTMIEKNMTGFELSQKLEVTPSMISNYISGRRFPGFYSLKKLALALDVSIDYLLGLSEEKTIELSGDTLKEEHDISEEEAKLRFIFDCLTEGDYKKAKEAYDSLNAYKLKGMALYETALLSLLMQKEKKAIELLERFNSFNLQESCGLSKLGDIYRACGDLERAKDYYTKALKRNEKDSKATENLGEIAIFKGDYTEAYFWYDKLARDYPLEAKAYLRIGEILGELGRSPASRQNFLAGVILNACSSKPLEIATDTFHEVLGEEIKTEELIEAIEAVRRNGDRERNGQELGQRREARGERFEEREDHRELEIKREGEMRREFSSSRERSELSFFLGSYQQPTTHNPQRISREHSPSAGACRHPAQAGTKIKSGRASGHIRRRSEERRTHNHSTFDKESHAHNDPNRR